MIMDTIKSRRSIRTFQEKVEVETEKVLRVIDAAQWAPSACNKQLWEFIVVTDKRIKERIVTEAKAVSFLQNAPLLIFVLYPKDINKEYFANIQSAAAAIQNMLLVAYEEGLGSVWIAACGERRILHKILNVPESFLIVSAVALGYPKKQPVPPQRRSLNEIIHFNSYPKKKEKRFPSFHLWNPEAILDYRSKGIRATSPSEEFFENLSAEAEFYKEIEISLKYIQVNSVLLDILSFSGNHILEILKRKALSEVYIHDVSEDIYYFLEERKDYLGLQKVKINFQLGTLSEILYTDNYFDVVTCFKKLNLIHYPQKMLHEIHRVLKNNGRLILSLWNFFSSSGINYLVKNTLLEKDSYITNEGPLRPLNLFSITQELERTGFKIEEQIGVTILPKRINQFLKLKNSFSRTWLRNLSSSAIIVARKE